jgi:hypothetical protein
MYINALPPRISKGSGDLASGILNFGSRCSAFSAESFVFQFAIQKFKY